MKVTRLVFVTMLFVLLVSASSAQDNLPPFPAAPALPAVNIPIAPIAPELPEAETRAGTVQTDLGQLTLVVDSLGDLADANLNDGICEDSNGDCSLRAAIQTANANTGKDLIHFNFSHLFQPYTITLTSNLPVISNAVVIDGTTEPAFNAVTNTPSVLVDGADAASYVFGVRTSNSVIKGLSIGNATGANVVIKGNKNKIQGNLIGLTATNADVSGIYGVSVNGSYNVIGGAGALRNVISNNRYEVTIFDATSTGNRVQGNVFGSNITGTSGAISMSDIAVYVFNAPANVIGGTIPNYVVSSMNGVIVQGSSASANIVQGNIFGLSTNDVQQYVEIGVLVSGAPNTVITQNTLVNMINLHVVDSAGTQITENKLGFKVDGTEVDTNNPGIFLTNVTRTAVKGNKLTGKDTGLMITGFNNQVNISGNTFGLKLDGTPSTLSNNVVGINASSATNLNITNNVFANMNQPAIAAGQTKQVTVKGNKFGTDKTGTITLPVQIGVYTVEVDKLIVRNNHFYSVSYGDIVATQTGEAIVQGNIIGVDASGTVVSTLGQAGISFINSGTLLVGGTTPGAGNLITSRVAGISSSYAEAVTLQGNMIGVNQAGTQAMPNTVGVSIQNTNHVVIGGAVAEARNIISGNTEYGLLLQNNGTQTTIQGNYIGTDVTGKAALGNGADGVAASTITETASGITLLNNTLSGNGENGITIVGLSANIQGNRIGTDVTGTVALGNVGSGVYLELVHGDVKIGGTAPNVIAANGQYGIEIYDSIDVSITGNRIGANLKGKPVLSNGQAAIFADATGGVKVSNNVLVSDHASAVIIASAGEHSVLYEGNSLINNRIFTDVTQYLPVDLAPYDVAIPGHVYGQTANDPLDVDEGANGLQNTPEVYRVKPVATGTQVSGAFNSEPNQTYTLHFYQGTQCQIPGTWTANVTKLLGTMQVTTDFEGKATFKKTFKLIVPEGQFVSATATDSAGSTSEFSECQISSVLIP